MTTLPVPGQSLLAASSGIQFRHKLLEKYHGVQDRDLRRRRLHEPVRMTLL